MEEGLNETAQPVPKAVDKHESDNASHAAQPEAEGELRDANLYEYLHGMRFVLVTISLAAMVFRVNLEAPVVSKSLVKISDDLGGFERSSWLVSSYLLGYVAVIVIFAKVSDILGRKPIYIFSMLIFVIFSAACSAAQTMTQLIIFRTLQGLGGGGCFSLSTIIIIELMPPAQYSKYVTQLSIATTVALMLGPIVGGAISLHTTWRWIFIINVPVVAVALVFAAIGFPRHFPPQGSHGSKFDSVLHVLTKPIRDRLDVLGAALILGAVVLLTAAFEEAGSVFPWRSAYVVASIIISGVLWILLFIWEYHITRENNTREPVLPWRFFTNRLMIGVLISFVFVGAPVVVSIFVIPQRYQLVYGLSGLDAGVRLIPFTIFMPIGAAIAAVFTNKLKIAAIWVIMGGACLEIVGFALLGTLLDSLNIPPRIYGFRIIAGIGCGCNYTLLFLIVPQALQLEDHAVGMGAASQFRQMGSSIGIAITTAVFNSHISSSLSNQVATANIGHVENLSKYLNTLPAATQEEVRMIIARGYNLQMLVLCGFAAAQLPAAFLLWRRNQVKV